MAVSQFHATLLTSSGQEWQFHIATDVQWSWQYLSSKNGNFTLNATSRGNWSFHIPTDI